ncbi:unnamed protein product [Caenorhabditis auriculariae]|uniref:Palmitoyltransferase n=1 Tax=Caenorhabditis auriculariae TaxID=2777116 RepID=A0A8S1H0F8_9PELO|nr:unnamed protein product [Caenorhabditis auriculariae]
MRHYVVIVWMLYPTFQETMWGIFHAAFFNLLLLGTVVAHTKTMFSDPGIVPISKNKTSGPRPLSSEDESESDEEAMMRHPYFGTRGSPSEWTMKMDHHCPWVNNCVGELNQKHFLQFIIYVGVTSLYALFILIICWVYDDEFGTTGMRGPNGENAHHTKVLHSIFLAMESALFGMFVMAVSCDQLSAIFSDETAVEAVQRRARYGSSRRPRTSKIALLRQVCGPGPKILWLIPCRWSSQRTPSRYVRSHHQLSHFDV